MMGDMVFKEGDRVILTSPSVERVYGFPVGSAGVVKHIGIWNDLGVVFDNQARGGHNLGFDDIPYGHGLWVHITDVQPEVISGQIDDISPDDLMEMLK